MRTPMKRKRKIRPLSKGFTTQQLTSLVMIWRNDAKFVDTMLRAAKAFSGCGGNEAAMLERIRRENGWDSNVKFQRGSLIPYRVTPSVEKILVELPFGELELPPGLSEQDIDAEVFKATIGNESIPQHLM